MASSAGPGAGVCDAVEVVRMVQRFDPGFESVFVTLESRR